ncbi:hypothetical protein Pmar_PMAR024078 [Perkinsus marinus ATCC 50983]|uniref:Uncharacterized protein n=1 Tax=Perkinsus marinus (strain ATCC 50983 / TXsc) TaxID=423536 RepID=C5L6L1_PERM5|nr:hypothetical protein Pmar_PMAR024078 [Perkinsus marinus ATCC 50983]EER07672.1 hypothetical protein Pmar_PMAR024078 [Perkinsus marinus ATCC 50983]|eukprot:XP_002775856.1 hypothetical protein Pmar_PMAR024078 [Perkinsus marinus ATCC 50983]
MTQWKPTSRRTSPAKEKRETRSEKSSEDSNRAASSQVKKQRFSANLSTQKALMQWIEAEHLRVLYSKEEVEKMFGNGLGEEEFVDNCREYATRVMPDREDVYHSSMEDIINELLNIAVMDAYAAKADGDAAAATITACENETKADIADVTCINSVLTKIGLPLMSTTEATVQEVQTAIDCIQRLAAEGSGNLLPADINTLRVVLRDKYLDKCQSDINRAMAQLQAITANPVLTHLFRCQYGLLRSRRRITMTERPGSGKGSGDEGDSVSKNHVSCQDCIFLQPEVLRGQLGGAFKTSCCIGAGGTTKGKSTAAAATAAMREVITQRATLGERRRQDRPDDSDDESLISATTKNRIKEFLDSTARRIIDGPQLRSRGASPSPTPLSLTTTDIFNAKAASMNIERQGLVRRTGDQSFEAFLSASVKGVLAFAAQVLNEPRQLLAGLRPAIWVLVCMVALLIISSGCVLTARKTITIGFSTSLHQLDRAADFLPVTLVRSAQPAVGVVEEPVLNAAIGDGVRARAHFLSTASNHSGSVLALRAERREVVVGEAVQQRQPLQNATGASNVIIGLISSLSKGERLAASVVPKENNTEEKAVATPLVASKTATTPGVAGEPGADVYKKVLVNLAKMTGHENDIDGLLLKAASASASINSSHGGSSEKVNNARQMRKPAWLL